MLIDTHCHLHDREFFEPEQAEKMLARARENKVMKVVCIGTDLDDSLAAREFASSHPGVYWTYGIHPENANCSNTGVLSPALPQNFADANILGVPLLAPPSSLGAIFQLPRPIAIGEVGLDYHSEGYNRDAQIKLFEQMLQLAVDNDLPVSFHVRNAFDDFFPVVVNFPKVRGVVHSFTDSKKVLKRILEATDFYVGVNGLATYSTLPTPPLNRILLETDAPFLTPVPFRGMINEPAYILDIAKWLGEKLGVEFGTVERETTLNAGRLYRFSDTESAAGAGE